MNRLALSPFVCALALSPVLAAQAPPSQDGFTPAEASALARKDQGRFAAASEEFYGAIAAADLASPRGCALTEAWATHALAMTKTSGSWPGLRRMLAAVRTRAAQHPALLDALTLLDLEAALLSGDQAAAASATPALGFVTSWWIVGPFDNERGGGFGRVLAPEQTLDLDAVLDGKKRPVRWRQLPVASLPGGRIDFDALVRPNDQVLCYALALVHSDREQTVVARLGSDEAVKLFHHGVEVLARDVRRPFAYDQDAVTLRLRAGANLLLAKVCDQEGGFAFALRLTSLEGRAVDGVRFNVTETEVRAACRTWADGKTGRPAAGELADLGARTFFERSLAERPSGHDAYRLGVILAHRLPDDPNERRDHQLAQQALKAMSDSAAARMLLAFTRIRPAQIEAEKEESARRFDYETILATHPNHARALAELANMDLQSIGSAEQAQARLDRALATAPDYALARLELARALRQRKLDVLADREVERAAQGPEGGAAAVLAQWAEVQRRRGDHAGALESLARAHRAEATPQRALALVDAWLRAGQRDAAQSLLHELEQVAPFERAPRLRLGKLQRASSQLDDAVATLGRWLTICPEDDEALVELARVHGIAGRVDQQKELLRTALDLNKNLRNERRYLDFLEAEEKPFYDAYRLDADQVIGADRGPPADAAKANDPLHYLLDQTVVRAYRNGTTSAYQHKIVRILNDEGAEQMARHWVRHYPGEQRARVITARIVKKDGQVVRPKLREWGVDLPSLTAGDLVVLEDRVDDLAPSFFGDYFGNLHHLSEGKPVARAEFTAVLDPGRQYQVQVKNGVGEPARETLADGTQVLRFALRDVARIESEEFQPGWNEIAPLVRISTYADWDQFAAWWWNLIRKQSEVTPPMRAKVAELTKDAPTTLAKLDRLYRFVTTDVRYTAWEFGVHGYKPYSTPVIFERRHGDCKDKSLLLNALLSEVGVKAYPVLIWADVPHSSDDLSLAMVQHFNHCISYVPAQGDLPEMFLDGTATYHPIDTLPTMDRGARVLIVRDGKAELRDVPWTDAAVNVDDAEWDIDVAGNGDAKARRTHRPKQNHAVSVRDELGNEPAKRTEKLERQLGEVLGKVKVDSVATSDLLDLGKPVEVIVDLMVTEFAAKQDGGLVLKGSLSPTDLTQMTAKPTRTFALLKGTPESHRTVLRYKLPPGFEPSSLPEPVNLQTAFGSFAMRWVAEPGTLRVERTLSYTANRIEPQEYPQFRDFAAAVQRAEGQVAIIKAKGGAR
jgi:tetratricopeptide (TPR) repeat protein